MTESQSSTSRRKPRADSISQASENSQTAADFIREQLSLEAEAREALPYQFDTCTRDLGPLRQGLYSCLDCNPPPSKPSDPYQPAAVCYACSISCHGEHTLVELFNKRNFVCDCGTSRLPEATPCTLRVNPVSGQKDGVTGEEPAASNRYNQNFRNKFCGCGEEYNPHQEKGTMFQCLGLGTMHEGGCGEDWWHPECVLGLSREEFKRSIEKPREGHKDGSPLLNGITKEVSVTRHEETDDYPDARRPSIVTAIAAGLTDGDVTNSNDITVDTNENDEDTPLPPGFPMEDDFEYFLCYKCVEAFPWIRKYASTPGFLPPVYFDVELSKAQSSKNGDSINEETNGVTNDDFKKRKADDDEDTTVLSQMAPPKRKKSEDSAMTLSSIPENSTSTALPFTSEKASLISCKIDSLPPLSTQATTTPFSLFMKPDFYKYLCRCPSCFPLLKPHPQLLEEEDVYEPPVSEDGDGGDGSIGTGSLLDRGEAAFNNMDRVRALQGAMAYAHLKDGLKAFLKPYAESGQAVGAEDIKAYFEKLRGDEKGIKEAAGEAKKNQDGDGGGGDDNRREQSGY